MSKNKNKKKKKIKFSKPLKNDFNNPKFVEFYVKDNSDHIQYLTDMVRNLPILLKVLEDRDDDVDLPKHIDMIKKTAIARTVVFMDWILSIANAIPEYKAILPFVSASFGSQKAEILASILNQVATVLDGNKTD